MCTPSAEVSWRHNLPEEQVSRRYDHPNWWARIARLAMKGSEITGYYARRYERERDGGNGYEYRATRVAEHGGSIPSGLIARCGALTSGRTWRKSRGSGRTLARGFRAWDQAVFDLVSVLGFAVDFSVAGDGDALSVLPEDSEDEDSLEVDGPLSDPLLLSDALLELDLAGRLSVR